MTSTFTDCTLYVSTFYGYRRIECQHFRVHRRPWAQYSNAVEYAFVEDDGVERGTIVGRHPRLVVVAGHGHPDIPGANNGPETKFPAGITTSHHSTCLPGDDAPFNAFFEAYQTRHNPKVLVDIREE